MIIIIQCDDDNGDGKIEREEKTNESMCCPPSIDITQNNDL